MSFAQYAALLQRKRLAEMASRQQNRQRLLGGVGAAAQGIGQIGQAREKAAKAADLKKTLEDDEYQPKYPESLALREKRDMNAARIHAMKQANELKQQEMKQQELKDKWEAERRSFDAINEGQKRKEDVAFREKELKAANRRAGAVQAGMTGRKLMDMGSDAAGALRKVFLPTGEEKASADLKKAQMEREKAYAEWLRERPDIEREKISARNKAAEAGIEWKAFQGLRRQASINVGRMYGVKENVLAAIMRGESTEISPDKVKEIKEALEYEENRLIGAWRSQQGGVVAPPAPGGTPPPPGTEEPNPDQSILDVIKQYEDK